MRNVSIAVCAHQSRTEQASTLATQLAATDLVIDDGSYGSTANHARAWASALKYATDHEWVGVVEDDALPIPEIRVQLPAMLAHSPTGLVSAYLGTGRPPKYQAAIQAVLQRRPQWVLSTDVLHHVAVFARREHVPNIISYLNSTRLPCDEALGVWSRLQRIPVTYPVPSLFDHEDGPPAIAPAARAQPITQPRKAWRVGRSDDWSAGPVALVDTATVNYYGGRYG